MVIYLIAGARPNFMKIAPVYRESIKHHGVVCKIIHTGQHYDYDMSQTFFDDLEIPEPDHFLNAGSGSHAEQTSKIMIAFEKLCQKEPPDLIMVVGDVNSTLACSITAKKLWIPVAHIEAGLRSFDLTMPEEINRMVTDAISDYFFVTEKSGIENLEREGKEAHRIHFVGNVMIDNLFRQARKLNSAGNSDFQHLDRYKKDEYIFLTLHRPSNVDSKEQFTEIAEALNTIAEEKRIVFPVHPRTRHRIDEYNIKLSKQVITLNPLGFKESLFLWKDATLVITDSGGLQEETTALGVPCLTIRENTERPITIEKGTNVLGGTSRDTIMAAYQKSNINRHEKRDLPEKWDGRTAERIWEILLDGFK
jgi:UDP-N-acetylglucosamine 2-epimerase (non-hydrolysing)